jgi:hypothetical protein
MEWIDYINHLKSLFIQAYSDYVPEKDLCDASCNDFLQDITQHLDQLTEKKADYLSRVAKTSTDGLDKEKINKLVFQCNTLDKEFLLLRTATLAIKFLLPYAQQNQLEIHRLKVENLRQKKEIETLKLLTESAANGEKTLLEHLFIELKKPKEDFNYRIKIR